MLDSELGHHNVTDPMRVLHSTLCMPERRTWFGCWQECHSKMNSQLAVGFNILTRCGVSVIVDNVGYLPTICAPATQMSTVNEVLNQSKSPNLSVSLIKPCMQRLLRSHGNMLTSSRTSSSDSGHFTPSAHSSQ